MTVLPRAIHYYNWEGDPCRLLPLEDDEEGYTADIYIAGKGFMPTSPVELMYKAARITEAEFKQKVQQRIAANRHG